MSTALRTYWRGATLAAMQDHVAGVTRTYHLDHQGTVQCLTDDNSVVTDRFACDAWGNQFKRTGTSINRHWYVGNLGYYRQVDQALDYVRARYLVALHGRWLGRDFLFPWLGYPYAGGQPVASVDPSGWKPVIFEFNAFIPGRIGGWFRDPWPLVNCESKGDSRGFGGGTARLRCRGTIETTTFQVSGPRCYSDASHRRCFSLTTGKLEAEVGTGHPTYRVFFTRSAWEPCKVSVHVFASVRHPLIPVAPTVDVAVVWTITASPKKGKDMVRFTVVGSHDAFPNYEAVLLEACQQPDNERLLAQVYACDTPDSGPTPVNLNSTVEFPEHRADITANLAQVCRTPLN